MLAVGLFYCFYEHFHVWKKEGVVVGFVYDDSEEVQKNIAQRKSNFSFWLSSQLW